MEKTSIIDLSVLCAFALCPLREKPKLKQVNCTNKSESRGYVSF